MRCARRTKSLILDCLVNVRVLKACAFYFQFFTLLFRYGSYERLSWLSIGFKMHVK